jgi:hypothetical protein
VRGSAYLALEAGIEGAKKHTLSRYKKAWIASRLSIFRRLEIFLEFVVTWNSIKLA